MLRPFGERPVECGACRLRLAERGQRLRVQEVMDRFRRRQGEQPLRLRHRQERRVGADEVGDERPLRLRGARAGVDRRLEFVRPVGDPLPLGEPGQVFAPGGGFPGLAAPRQQVPQVEVRLRGRGRNGRRRPQLEEGFVALPARGERQTEGDPGAGLLFPGLPAFEQRRAPGLRGRQGQRRPQRLHGFGAPSGLVEQQPQPEAGAPVPRFPRQGLPVGRLRRLVLAQVVEHIAAAEAGFGALRSRFDRPGAGGLRVFQPFLPGTEQADLQERPRIAGPERQRRVQPPAGLGVIRESGVECAEMVLRLERTGIARCRAGERRETVGPPPGLHIEHAERRQHLRPARVLGAERLQRGHRLLAPPLRGEHQRQVAPRLRVGRIAGDRFPEGRFRLGEPTEFPERRAPQERAVRIVGSQ